MTAGQPEIPEGHEAITVRAKRLGVPITDGDKAVSKDGKILGTITLVWPRGIANDQAVSLLTDMYLKALEEVQK